MTTTNPGASAPKRSQRLPFQPATVSEQGVMGHLTGGALRSKEGDFVGADRYRDSIALLMQSLENEAPVTGEPGAQPDILRHAALHRRTTEQRRAGSNVTRVRTSRN